jgi:hypothetical protein
LGVRELVGLGFGERYEEDEEEGGIIYSWKWFLGILMDDGESGEGNDGRKG